MSGFGLRAYKKLDDDQNKEQKRQYFEHVVYGENFLAALTFLKLQEKFGSDKVKLICQNELTKDAIINEWKCTLNTIRNENVAKTLMEKTSRLEIMPSEHRAEFYKDSKFHPFGGRTKSFEIQDGEGFFIDSFFNIKTQGLFSEDQWSSLDETLKASQLNKFIDKIELTEPSDMLEKTNYVLHTGEYERIECEQMYWCESPKDFYKKIENKNKVNDALGEFCNSIEHRAAMAVHFEVDQKIFSHKGTVFLPQSVTHEWGHFICDFNEFDPTTQKQAFTCMMFVNEDEVNEEELAKKIRLMKRVIERTMPEFSKANITEQILYRPSMFITNVKDELLDDIEFDHSHLKFVGQGAPIGAQSAPEFTYGSRALMSYFSLD